MISVTAEERLVLSRVLMTRRCSLKPWIEASSSSRPRFLDFDDVAFEYIGLLELQKDYLREFVFFTCWSGRSRLDDLVRLAEA